MTTTYLRNNLTGLYFDGTAFNAATLNHAKPVPADAAPLAHQFWANVEVVESPVTPLRFVRSTPLKF